MKIVIAIDSFKGSMSSMEAGYAAKRGINHVCDADVVIKPLADGGEGTVEALTEGLGGRFVRVNVTGPMGTEVKAKYGIMDDGITAIMEMAEAAGITLVEQEELNPWKATSYGVGEMILDAVKKGCRNFIIGIGGSATTDGGVGMLQALGFKFLDDKGSDIDYGAGALDKIAKIDTSLKIPVLNDCHFKIACDVRNPLYGKNGAVYVYGAQKGVKETEKELFDEKIRHFADITSRFLEVDYSQNEGSGAAGGLGYAFLSYMPNVRLQTGTEIVLNAVGLEEEIKDADIVITGEGRLDSQTAMGKLPTGVAHLAKKYGKKVIAFAGSITEDAAKCNEEGIDAFFPIVRGVTTLKEAMDTERAKKNMTLAVEQVFRLILK